MERVFNTLLAAALLAVLAGPALAFKPAIVFDMGGFCQSMTNPG